MAALALKARLYAAAVRAMMELVRLDNPFAARIVPLCMSIVETLMKGVRRFDRLPLEWMDANTVGRATIILPAEAGASHGPRTASPPRIVPVQLPAVVLHEFEHACVGSLSSSVIVGNRLLLERLEGVDPRHCSFATGHVFMHGQRFAYINTRPTHPLEAGLFLGGNGSFNYYHWMVEILPKLEFLPAVEARHPGVPLLVGGTVGRIPTFCEALARLAPGRTVKILDDRMLYNVGKLLYLSAPNLCPFNLAPGARSEVGDFHLRRSSIAYLRSAFGVDGEARAAGCGRRVFLARKGGRRKYNQDEVLVVLEEHSFQPVFMEELSLADQIAVMADADMVAGPSGAAWTNILFCRPGTRALCWMAEEASEFAAYSNLAAAVGAELRYIYFCTGARSSQELFAADYRLDPATVARALQELAEPARVPQGART